MSSSAQARDGFPITALRETNILLALQHAHVVAVREMVVGKRMDDVFMVSARLVRGGKGDHKSTRPPALRETPPFLSSILPSTAFNLSERGESLCCSPSDVHSCSFLGDGVL
jgi:hypothetical protein